MRCFAQPKKYGAANLTLIYIFSLDGTISDYAANYQIGGGNGPAHPHPCALDKDTAPMRPATTVYFVDAGTQPERYNERRLVRHNSNHPRKSNVGCWTIPEEVKGIWSAVHPHLMIIGVVRAFAILEKATLDLLMVTMRR